jgi:site-specific DNA recombinase
LQTQTDSCRKYAAENGFTVAAEAEFREEGVSGAKLDRPELDKLRALIDQNQLDAVIVHTADRLSRNLAHSYILRDEWQKAGVELHCVDRGLSQDTAEGRLSDNVQAVIAEYEREKIRERTRRGKLAKAQAGKWVGGSPPAYGYKTHGRGREVTLCIDEAEALTVRRIFDMYAGGDSLLTIAARLTAESVPPPNRGSNGRGWYIRTVKAILQRRGYIGEFTYRSVIIPLPHLAIVEPATWAAAQAQRGKNIARSGRNRQHDYLLSSFIRCACGRAMCGIWAKKRKGGKYFYYRCSSDDKHLIDCREKWLRADIADCKVWAWVYGLLENDRQWEAGLLEWRQRDEAQLFPKRKQIALLEERIGRIERNIKRLAAFAGDSENEELEELAANYHAQAKAGRKQCDALIVERDKLTADIERIGLTEAKEINIRAAIRAIRARLGGANYEQKREVFDLLNLSCQLGYKEGERGLWCSLSIRVEPEFVDLQLGNKGEGDHAGGTSRRRRFTQ